MKRKILLLEDDITLNETVVEYLEDNDFEVVSIYDGEEAYTKIYEEKFDLLIFDVNVPTLSGFELLENLRIDNINTPVIFMTSLNSMESFEKGFNLGCDDYIRKPFELKELLIRVESILKRGYFHSLDTKVNIIDDIFFDTSSNLLFKNNEEIKINNKETKLLKLFLQNQDQILSHDQIYEYVWDYGEESSDFSLRTYIKNLRKIFGKERIISVKKLGYRFTTE
ncbi:response regulator transcription factor [Arcobacter sp.]|uniref:response regulator transcription factor n=1 Tax=Arcobacter sp. TaxID=1872629 RepID=UPI003C78E3C2